jgi:hypothetical protein
MKIEVITTQYEFAHGHAPRGRGFWAFELAGKVVFIPGSKLYAEAKREALALARAAAVSSINVCA